jgi:integrase
LNWLAMAKHGNGEGTIRKRSDSRWEAMLSLPDGKRRSLYGRTRAEVAHKLAAASRDRDLGLPVSASRQPLAQFLSQWLEDAAKPSLRPKTYASYEQLIRIHIAPAVGKIPLVSLTPQRVQRFVNDLSQSGLSPRTVQYVHAVLRRALGQAYKWGMVPRNVATLVNVPRVHRTEIRPFDPHQARAFLEAIHGERLEALYVLAMGCGLRAGEVLGLTWRDVDLEGETLTVARALQRLDRRLQLVEPKTARSRRTLALPEIVASALREHRERQLEERRLAGSSWHELGMVFTNRRGGPIHPENLSRNYSRLLDRLGFPHQRFHDLRHGCASLLIAQGVGPREIMDVLGHSQIAVTMDIYGHIFQEVRREVAKRMDAALVVRPEQDAPPRASAAGAKV